jgi:hypothetical protein
VREKLAALTPPRAIQRPIVRPSSRLSAVYTPKVQLTVETASFYDLAIPWNRAAL